VLGIERGIGISQGNGGADFNAIGEVLDALHLGHVADVDHHRQRAMKLGDLQRQIGTACQQPGLGLGLVEFGQVADGQGQQAAFIAAVEFAGLAWGDCLELGDGCAVPGIELIRLLPGACLFGSRQYGPVARAATEVAGKCLVGLMAISLAAAVFLQGEQRHHKTRGAKAALRAVAVDHRPLHAVQLALVFQVFDADQLFAVQCRDKGQARIQAAIAQPLKALVVRVQLADHHGAGAAVTAGAAFFGAGFVQVLAQIVEHGQVGVQRVLGAQRLVE